MEAWAGQVLAAPDGPARRPQRGGGGGGRTGSWGQPEPDPGPRTPGHGARHPPPTRVCAGQEDRGREPSRGALGILRG